MGGLPVAAALLSVLLHAGWNAVVKASPPPTHAMIAQMQLSALLALPVLAWAGLPTTAAWPWVPLAFLLNMGALAALLRACEQGGVSVV
jgi:hypothetical protein